MAQKTFTFKQYRAADLTIFLLILCVFEVTVRLLAYQWTETPYCVSLFYAVCAIVMMRWGGWAVVHCVAAAVIQCAVASKFGSVDIWQWASYIVGYCCSLSALILLRLVGKQKVRDSALLTLAYVAILYVTASFGTGAALSVAKSEPFGNTVAACFATEALSGVLACVVALIARKQNGLFEDQKSYLIRTDEERRKELQNHPPEE